MKWMIRVLFLSLQFLLCEMQAQGQVWNGDLLFTSQTEIDDFANQPYTSVNGKLTILDAGDNSHDIRNLAGLAGLISVSGAIEIMNNNLLPNTVYLNIISAGSIRILGNPALTIINGLNLTSVPAEIVIEGNATLTSITAFGSITSISGQLIIQNNGQLNNLSGFANLQTVGGSLIIGSTGLTNLNGLSNLSKSNLFSVRNNSLLTNLNGLSRFADVDQLQINNNPLLVNIDGLSALTRVTSILQIQDNPFLQNLNGISNLGSTSLLSIQIRNNNSLQTINGSAFLQKTSSLSVQNNPALTSISGFSNLKASGSIEIFDNHALTIISGFNNLDTIYGSLNLQQNHELTTINAFPKIAFVAGNYESVNNYKLASIAPMLLLDSIGGQLIITLDTMLTNLDHVTNLRGTRSGLRITSCYRLANISGLSHLRTLSGDVFLSYLPLITNLAPLSQLRVVSGQLNLTSLNGLSNLVGLHNIKKVGTDLYVVGCTQLSSLNGLIGIDSIGRDLVIAFNPSLTNLNALHFLRRVSIVSIQSNAMLSEYCGLYGLYAGGGPTMSTTIIQNLVNPTPSQIISAGPCALVPTPVTLRAFNLRCEQGKIVLHWVTATEYNNRHFVVQRSSDGISWTDLKVIPGAVNSNSERTYSFIDEQPLSKCLYRLAQYDIDGRVNYSAIIRAACGIQSEITVSPNPAIDKVIITIPATTVSPGIMKIFDSKGVFVRSKQLTLLPGLNQFEISIADMPQGVYIIQVSNGGEGNYKNKLILKNGR